MTPRQVFDKPFAELTPHEVYDILALRSEVFVVEQDCVFLDADGRDTTPNVRHIWIEHDRRVIALCRLIDEGTYREIGRVTTSSGHRGQGLAGKLLDYCFATSDGPWKISAQAHLVEWYASFGFVTAGEQYLDDGIWHQAMTKPEPLIKPERR